MPGRDPFEGFKLYCRPEIAQNPVAAFERARCYKDGLGVRKNKLRAQDEYRRAIKLRDSKHKVYLLVKRKRMNIYDVQSTVVPAEPTSRIPLLKENGLKSSGGSMHTLNLNSPPSQESKMVCLFVRACVHYIHEISSRITIHSPTRSQIRR